MGARLLGIAPMLAQRLSGKVLSVGCGVGVMEARIAQINKQVEIQGTDILEQAGCAVPFTTMTGTHIPFGDGSFDWVLLIDTVHHSGQEILSEAFRVARIGVLVKDHVGGPRARRWILLVMDHLGNPPEVMRTAPKYLTLLQWYATLNKFGHITWEHLPGHGFDIILEVKK